MAHTEYGLSFVGDGNTQIRWRFPIAFQLVPLIGLVIFTYFLPGEPFCPAPVDNSCLHGVLESPRWLLKAGRADEAQEILGRLRSDDGTPNEQAMLEFNEIEQTIRLDGGEEPSYLQMFFSPCGKLHLSRRVRLCYSRPIFSANFFPCLSCRHNSQCLLSFTPSAPQLADALPSWIQIMQEWGGIAAITIYQPIIFSLAGFSASKAGWISGVNTITYMLSTCVRFRLDPAASQLTLPQACLCLHTRSYRSPYDALLGCVCRYFHDQFWH